MKKRIPLLLFYCFIFYGAFAQVRLGAYIGVHSANVDEKNNLPGWDTAYRPFYSPRTGISLGFFGDMPIGNKGFYFQPGINFSAKGRNFFKNYDTSNMMVLDSSYTVNEKNTLKLNYIEIPLNIAVKIPISRKNNNKFFISAGPYIAFIYSANMNTQSLSVKHDTTFSFNSNNIDLPVGNATNKYKTVDLGVNGKIGFELGKVILSGYVSMGGTNFFSAPYESRYYHNVIGASIGIWLNNPPIQNPPPKIKKIKDSDNDGIPDKEDKCPRTPGLARYNGCPIPDTDGDGVDDEHDSCKTVKGVAKYNGCPIPDTDGDGIDDEHDSCVTIKGIAKYNGCPVPDTDGDGVDDEHDSCKTVVGTAKYKGCPVPDTDGDGINDDDDKCPTIPGVKENNGCPAIQKEIKEQVNYVAKNILFANNSTKLTGESYDRLNELTSLLKKHRELNLLIEGYTDNKGIPEHNLLLSQNRANAVKNYLISNGISQDRLTALGKGQDNPIADNSTEEGKAKNRRVEMKLTSN